MKFVNDLIVLLNITWTYMKATGSKRLLEAAKFPEENPNPVFRISLDGTLLYANKASKNIMDYHCFEVGKKISGLWMDWLNEVNASQASREYEYIILQRTFLMNFVLIKRPKYVNIYCFDITERNTFQKSLERSEAKLKETSQILETILSNTSSLIAYMDKDFNFIKVNETYAKADGKSPDFFIGKNHFELFPNEENEKIFREVVNTGKAYHVYAKPFEYEYNKERGISYWNWSLCPIKNSSHKVTGLVLTLMDVTDRIKAAQKIEESEKRLDRILTSAMDAIISIDSEHRIILFNQAAERLFQYEKSVVIGKDLSMLIPPEFRERHVEHIKNFSKLGESLIKKDSAKLHLGLKKDGKTFPFESSVSESAFNGKKIFTIILRDITEKKKYEDSLAFHALLLENVSDAVIGTDNELKITYWNKGAENLYGWKAEEVLGKQTINILKTEFSDEERSRLYLELKKNGFTRTELIQFTKTDKKIAIDGFTKNILNKNGEVSGIISVNRDITEKKKAEEILKLNEARFRYAIENLPFTFDILDKERRYQYMNAYARRAINKPLEEVLGKKDEDLFPKEVTKEYVQIIDKCIRTKQAQTKEISICLWGQKLILVANYIPIIEDGEIYQILGVFFNVTKQREAEESLNRVIENLNRSNKELEQFAYIASHDLQEPLRMIMWYTGFLSKRYKGQLDEKADDFIYFINSAATRMSQLIRDLLSYGRINSANKPFESFDLNSVLKEVTDTLTLQIVESNAIIECDPLPQITADRIQISQLLQNLLANAIKFRSNKPLTILLRYTEKENEWIFSLQDNGIGIDPEYFDRIFQIFQQLHERDKYPGTGVGLAICKKIAERHCGRIWVESEPGKGSTFYFSIRKFL